jgi:hypothetical protein
MMVDAMRRASMPALAVMALQEEQFVDLIVHSKRKTSKRNLAIRCIHLNIIHSLNTGIP